MPGIIGKKIGMTRIIQDDGCVIPITVVKCDPNEIVQIKTADKDGYPAMVLGFLPLKNPKKNKKFKVMREFRIKNDDSYNKGDKISVSVLKDIKEVAITGIGKGKGFQGTVKRYHFSCGPKTHGSHFRREPGAIGARVEPGRVHPGKKLPGHMGSRTVTIKNIPIVYLDENDNLVGVKGSVPGAINGVVIIKY